MTRPMLSAALAAVFLTNFLSPLQTQHKEGEKPSTLQEAKKAVQTRPLWKPPYDVLPVPTDASGLADKLQGSDSAVWVEGDVLTLLHRSSADNIFAAGTFQQPMQRITGTDLWILRLKMEGWEKAFFSYAFFSPTPDQISRIRFETWFGPQAPPKPERAEKLQGTLQERTLHSASMGEDRKLTVYLPPNAPKRNLPAFFMADGQGCEPFAQVLEPLILAGKVKPCAIVGVHSGENKNKPGAPYDPKLDNRMLEYYPGDDPVVFGKHMEFFTREVPDYVAKEFGISKRRQDRALFGFSNGGAFSAAAGVDHPEVFGTVMPFSAGARPAETKPNSPLPVFHFSAGQMESFIYWTTKTYEKMKSWGAKATLDIYASGHDPEQWHVSFAHLAPKVFPGRSS